MVRTHEETGNNYVTIGAEAKMNGSWIVGLELGESAAIIKLIMDHVRQPRYQFKHAWKKGQMLMWHNGWVMHRRDEWPEEEGRTMYRTSTEGTAPKFVF